MLVEHSSTSQLTGCDLLKKIYSPGNDFQKHLALYFCEIKRSHISQHILRYQEQIHVWLTSQGLSSSFITATSFITGRSSVKWQQKMADLKTHQVLLLAKPTRAQFSLEWWQYQTTSSISLRSLLSSFADHLKAYKCFLKEQGKKSQQE